MGKKEMRLVPVPGYDPAMRGKYAQLMKQFLSSDETVMAVKAKDATNAYMGARRAIDRLDLHGQVDVRKQGPEVYLIKVV